MATPTNANNSTNKPRTGGKIAKNQNEEKAGRRKKALAQYKDPSNMCWDPFPLYPYDVKDVNKPNKYILLVIISVLWCFSLVTVCIGSYLIVQRKSREEVISAASFSDFWLNFSLVLLCNGIVSSIITFCGLVGVLRENVPLIRVFYVSLIVSLLLKFGLAVFVFVFADYSRPLLEGMLAEQAVVDYRTSSDVETLMDYLQTTFHCCGLRDDGFQDWSRNIYFNCSDGSPSPERCGVPWSCCRNHTGVSNALCGLGVQKLDRNIASRTIHTMGCLHAIQLWVFSHAVVTGLAVLLEVSVIVAVTFQCTRIVNELQMINGVYRGPWWDRVGAPRQRRQQKRPALPPSTSQRPRLTPAPSERSQPEKPPSETDQERTEPSSVLQIGHGPAVRRTKTAPPVGRQIGLDGKVPGQPPGEASNQPANQQPPERSIQQSREGSSHQHSEGSNQHPRDGSSQHPDKPPATVTVHNDGQVIGEHVFATTFRDVTGAGAEETVLPGVAEMLDTAARQSYFCLTEAPSAAAATASETSAGSADTVDSVAVKID